MRITYRHNVWFSVVRSVVLVAGMLFLLHPLSVAAAPAKPAPSASTSIKVCSAAGDPCSKFVDKYISPLVTLLTALIGIFAVISIILAGIQYATSADDPGAVSKAKNRIVQTVIGIVAYLFLFGFLNYLVPGGLF